MYMLMYFIKGVYLEFGKRFVKSLIFGFQLSVLDIFATPGRVGLVVTPAQLFLGLEQIGLELFDLTFLVPNLIFQFAV